MIKEFKARTGAIFSDTKNCLEYLYVGDYGKEANIKADFLGLTKELIGVTHKKVNLEDKMVVTISTQKGCPMKCKFCDCPKVGFHGNAEVSDLRAEVMSAIVRSGCQHTKRFNLHLARMGEPSFNWITSRYICFAFSRMMLVYLWMQMSFILYLQPCFRVLWEARR